MPNPINELFRKMRGKPANPSTEAPLGQGTTLDKAREAILKRQYDQHVQMAYADGDQPLTYQEFLESKRPKAQM